MSDTERIALDYVAARPGVELVKAKAGAIHAWGKLPNTNVKAWYFAGWIDELARMARAEMHGGNQ
jgi:hypothetical protein